MKRKETAKLIGISFVIVLIVVSLAVIGLGLATSLSIKPPKIIEIGYNIDGFKNNPLNINQCYSGDTVYFFPVEKEGYEFQYWTYADYPGNGYYVDKISDIQKSVVMRAVFKPIVYKAYMYIDDEIAYTIEFTADSDIEFGGASKPGYRFKGWMNKDGIMVKGIGCGSVGNRAYVAVWDKK